MSTSFQRQGDPVSVGWSIGRTPLWLRGIRFAEGDGGAPPAAPLAAPAGPAAAAPNPAQLAAFYAAQNGAQPPAPAPAPQAPAAPPVVQGFTPEQVQKFMAEADTAGKAAAAAQAALATMQKERDEAQGLLAGHARTAAVTTAAADKANAALLLDSASFQAAIKDVNLTDTTALTAAVTKFVTDNPAYAATPAAPQLPGSSGPAPAGSPNQKPSTLAGALAAALSD